jgi:hypothetical protein
MCTEVDSIPRIMLLTEQNLHMSNGYIRNDSWTPSMSSTSWLERKLFIHFKRFFRRNSCSTSSNSSNSSRRTSFAIEQSNLVSKSDEQIKYDHEQVHEQIYTLPVATSMLNNEQESNIVDQLPLPARDSLYDYDQLLHRCLQRHEQHRTDSTLSNASDHTSC